MTIEEIRQQLEDFKQIRTRNSITPESLGTLLENIVDASRPIILNVNVAESKTRFTDMELFQKVWNCMQNNEQVSFCIAISYASGSKNFYYPTCVKTSYISIHAKAGSCELHVQEDGSFTTSGTALW